MMFLETSTTISLFSTLLFVFFAVVSGGSSSSSSGRKSGSSSDSSSDVESYLDNAYDYVIIGGGPAGLSTMAFLNKLLGGDGDGDDDNSRILTIEKLGRIGGKGFTTYFKYNDKSIHFEHNAMRFRTNGYLYYVLEMTGLCDDISFFSNPGQSPDRRYHYRNVEATRSQLIDDSTGSINEYENFWQYVYNFTDYDVDLIRNGAENTLRSNFLIDNGGISPRNESEWIDCLYNWKLENVSPKDWNRFGIYFGLLNCSVEYFNYREDNQYPPFMDNSYGNSLCGNGGVVTDPFERPDGLAGSIKTLANGFGQISQELYNLGTDFETKHDVWLNTEVTGIGYTIDQAVPTGASSEDMDDLVDEYPYFVRVRDNDDWNINNEDVNGNNGISPIFAKNVIFSIPTRNFAQLFNSIDPWRNEKHIYELIRESKGKLEVAYRVNLIYDDEFLAGSGFNFSLKSQSKTDMMLRSVYFDSNWINDTLFAIQFYCRREQAEWLHALQGIGEPYISGEEFEIDEISEKHAIYTSKVLVDRLVRELSDLFNIDFPYPIAAFSQPLGLNSSNVDGLWLPKSGYVDRYVRAELRHPIEEENLFVASGAYSSWQADIYGAIEAAYILVNDVLRLGDPFEDVDFCFF